MNFSQFASDNGRLSQIQGPSRQLKDAGVESMYLCAEPKVMRPLESTENKMEKLEASKARRLGSDYYLEWCTVTICEIVGPVLSIFSSTDGYENLFLIEQDRNAWERTRSSFLYGIIDEFGLMSQVFRVKSIFEGSCL